MGERARWLIGTVIAMASLVIAWLAWQYPKAPQAEVRGASGIPTTVAAASSDSRNLTPDKFQVGDCLSGPNLAKSIGKSASWPTITEVVPCNNDHIAEVYFQESNHWKKYGTSPGATSLRSEGTSTCTSAFKAYIGIPFADSTYSINAIFPTAVTWTQGDRGLECVVFAATTKSPGYVVLNQSVKGAR